MPVGGIFGIGAAKGPHISKVSWRLNGHQQGGPALLGLGLSVVLSQRRELHRCKVLINTDSLVQIKSSSFIRMLTTPVRDSLT